MSFYYTLCGGIAVAFVWAGCVYYRLIKLRASIDDSWDDISSILKLRVELTTRLITLFKNHADANHETLEQIFLLRNEGIYASPLDIEAQAFSSGALSKGLDEVFVLANNYPDLKKAPEFLEIQTTLQKLELKLQGLTQQHNELVIKYNQKCTLFPSSLIAQILRFSQKTLFYHSFS